MQERTREKAMGVDQALREDDQKLEQTFQRVLDRFRGGDSDAIRACWLALDNEVAAHLDVEEVLMVPKFEQVDPAAAKRVLHEHEQIRAALERLGVELDLHALRSDSAAAFINMLREHGRYEEQVLYAWAQKHLTHEERRGVLSRLRGLRARITDADEAAGR